MKLETPGWRRAVDTLTQRDERHTEGVELIEERHEVP